MEQLLDENVLGKTTIRYAGFWERFLAMFIDGIILAIVNVGCTFAFKSMPMVGAIISFIAGVAYFVYFESSDKMGTIGKSALGLKVISSSTEDKITPMNALGRYFAKIPSALILLIGYFMMLFNDQKQTLHDKMAGTFVVKS